MLYVEEWYKYASKNYSFRHLGSYFRDYLKINNMKFLICLFLQNYKNLLPKNAFLINALYFLIFEINLNIYRIRYFSKLLKSKSLYCLNTSVFTALCSKKM